MKHPDPEILRGLSYLHNKESPFIIIDINIRCSINIPENKCLKSFMEVYPSWGWYVTVINFIGFSLSILWNVCDEHGLLFIWQKRYTRTNHGIKFHMHIFSIPYIFVKLNISTYFTYLYNWTNSLTCCNSKSMQHITKWFESGIFLKGCCEVI